jgi:hypothetical protein
MNDAGRVMTTDQLRQALSDQRARRGKKATKGGLDHQRT